MAAPSVFGRAAMIHTLAGGGAVELMQAGLVDEAAEVSEESIWTLSVHIVTGPGDDD